MFADNEALVTAVRKWAEKAENDLNTAVRTLKPPATKRPTDTACFHAQQCVEKYLKALLTWRGLPVPWTHDLAELRARLPQRDRPELTVAESETLTRYATVTRYPGDYEPIPLAEARQAVKIARRVRKQIRARLPKQALQLK
jgi:HEPN domain-containing protein